LFWIRWTAELRITEREEHGRSGDRGVGVSPTSRVIGNARTADHALKVAELAMESDLGLASALLWDWA